MIEQVRNIFRVPELKRRVLFTCALLIVYRIGAHVPTPGIDAHALAQFFQLRADRSLFLRNVAYPIEPALQLRPHLAQARAIRFHYIRLAAPQLIGHGGFGLQCRELGRQHFERQFAQLRFSLLQRCRVLRNIRT